MIHEISPLIDNLFDLTRPILALQPLQRQKGPYWERRQKILAVRKSTPPFDSRTSVPSMKSKRSGSDQIEGAKEEPLKNHRAEKSQEKKTENLNAVFDYQALSSISGESIPVTKPSGNASWNPNSGDGEKTVKEDDTFANGMAWKEKLLLTLGTC